MSITAPAGFSAAGVAAGLKSTGAKDVALVVNQGPTFDSATVFTANRCQANPILWSKEVVKDGTVRAVVINSGGANCYPGAEGFQTTHATAERVADHLGIGLRAATRVSFDRLDSDGCMSTNDTVSLLASGASGITPSLEDFTAALTQACTDLAMQLLKDAEGADHEIAITTLNAATEDEAVEVSRSVARSNLFKAAVFGNDPNWGRVLASIGTTDATFDPADLDVAINGVWVCKQSTPHADPATVDLKPREVSVTIDLKSGSERATVWTNDLTHAYVHENSAYSS